MARRRITEVRIVTLDDDAWCAARIDVAGPEAWLAPLERAVVHLGSPLSKAVDQLGRVVAVAEPDPAVPFGVIVRMPDGRRVGLNVSAAEAVALAERRSWRRSTDTWADAALAVGGRSRSRTWELSLFLAGSSVAERAPRCAPGGPGDARRYVGR